MIEVFNKKNIVACFVIAVVGILFLIYAYFIEPNRLLVNKTEIRIRSWNPAFDNFKIVAVSDIHGGSNAVTKEKLRQIVEIINSQKADLVVFLGDYVSNGFFDRAKLKMPVAEIADNLAGIKAKYGVFFVMGNHDGWFGVGEVRREITRVGYRVLENEMAFIEKNDQRLRILGLKDHMKLGTRQQFLPEIKEILEKYEQNGDLIVLEHSPDILPAISGDHLISEDLRLILAGHTHGGQIWLPFLGAPFIPSSYGQKYACGHIKENEVDMFVTTGIGTSILPFRFLVPPEIAVLTVYAE